VLTLQRANDAQIVTMPTAYESVENLLAKEWLLSNERGSYASSTILCCNTRGYHGLLIGSLNPPVNRMMALSSCLEMVMLRGEVFNLSTFEFSDRFSPEGFRYIKQFHRDIGVHFDYELAPASEGDVVPAPTFAGVNLSPRKRELVLDHDRGARIKLSKSIYLLRDTDTVAVAYAFTSVEEPVEFVLRPFVGMRDFHTLQKSYAPLSSDWQDTFLVVRSACGPPRGGGDCELILSCPSANFEKDPQWWLNFVYRNNRERGQDFTEDLWTPGFFKCRIEGPSEIVLWASLGPPTAGRMPEQFPGTDIDTVRQDLRRHQESVQRTAYSVQKNVYDKRCTLNALCLAADQFIAKSARQTAETDKNDRVTILAGFPWFADWGRDAFVALPGLLLSTGRFEDAISVLTTFAQAADEGMIPNLFDDCGDTAYFNSVDSSLWFINAAFQYLSATGDSRTFAQQLLPTIRWIIDSYQKGTRFGIHADADGLITAGDKDTQLTWMDAKCDGVAFTPRWGKAVEVNALWHNGLCYLARYYESRNLQNARNYESMAARVGRSFCELFWNEEVGYLNDCVLPDGSFDARLRPNQIFAVSLPFSPPLLPHQQRSIVAVVLRELLTPYGLRTLNVQHSDYRGTYTGSPRQRDEAYHQGTVWPYLMGAFVEAYLKVNGFSRKSKKEAAEFIQPLMQHLTQEGCLGSVSEIFDGDPPHKPRGCIAQAWSVAELLRAHQLINGNGNR
jgi:predicted glycogen debranching enzyme